MAMALAVAMVACSAAAGKPGEPGAPGAPGAPAQNPPSAVGKIMDITVVASETSPPMDVSGYFNEPESEVLAYTAMSDKPAVATAAASGSMVTVTGVAEGMAKITVTATDTDKLTVKQSFMVTVTPAEMTGDDDGSDTPDADVTISGKGEKAEHSIEAGQKLEPRDTNIVTVAPKEGSTTVWELTGVKRGTVKVDVTEGGTVVNTLTVEVLNTPPTAAKDQPSLEYSLEMYPSAPKADGIDDKVLNPRTYHKVVRTMNDLDVSKLFTDKDGSSTLNFTALSKSPYVKVVGITNVLPSNPGLDGQADEVDDNIEGGRLLILDVVKLMPGKFTVTVTATDDEDETHDVNLNIQPELPNAETFEVRQYPDDSFSSVTVMERQGVAHTLEFGDIESVNLGDDTTATVSTLGFVNEFLASVTKPEATTGTTLVKAGAPPKATNELPATSPEDSYGVYYTVAVTGPISIVPVLASTNDTKKSDLDIARGLANNGGVEIKFKLTGHETATVTITVHFVSQNPVEADRPAEPYKIQSKSSEPVTLNIERVRGGG